MPGGSKICRIIGKKKRTRITIMMILGKMQLGRDRS